MSFLSSSTNPIYIWCVLLAVFFLLPFVFQPLLVKERKWNKSEITLKDLFLKRDSESRRDISSLSVPEIKKGLKDD